MGTTRAESYWFPLSHPLLGTLKHLNSWFPRSQEMDSVPWRPLKWNLVFLLGRLLNASLTAESSLCLLITLIKQAWGLRFPQGAFEKKLLEPEHSAQFPEEHYSAPAGTCCCRGAHTQNSSSLLLKPNHRSRPWWVTPDKQSHSSSLPLQKHLEAKAEGGWQEGREAAHLNRHFL